MNLVGRIRNERMNTLHWRSERIACGQNFLLKDPKFQTYIDTYAFKNSNEIKKN